MLGQESETLLAFILPLWLSHDPIIQEVPIGTAAELLMTLMGRFSQSVGNLTGSSRAASRSREDASPKSKCHSMDRELDGCVNDFSWLVREIGEHLAELQPTTLIVCPHSHLNLLPIHAVSWNGKALLDFCPVVYLPAASIAAGLTNREELQADALLLGNPTGDLPHSQSEVERIAGRVTKQGFRTHVFVRDQATADSLCDHAISAGIVHAACHFRLVPHDFGGVDWNSLIVA